MMKGMKQILWAKRSILITMRMVLSLIPKIVSIKRMGKRVFLLYARTGKRDLAIKSRFRTICRRSFVLRRSTSSKEKSVRTRLFRQEELQPRLTAVPGQNGFRNIRITSWVKRSSFFRIMINPEWNTRRKLWRIFRMQKLFVCPACRLKAMYTTGWKRDTLWRKWMICLIWIFWNRMKAQNWNRNPKKENRVKIKHKKILYWKFSKSKVQHCLSTAKIMSRTLRLDKISIWRLWKSRAENLTRMHPMCIVKRHKVD